VDLGLAVTRRGLRNQAVVTLLNLLKDCGAAVVCGNSSIDLKQEIGLARDVRFDKYWV
jgi:hypothetical protein